MSARTRGAYTSPPYFYNNVSIVVACLPVGRCGDEAHPLRRRASRHFRGFGRLGERPAAAPPEEGDQGQGWILICQLRLLGKPIVLGYLAGSLDMPMGLC